MEALEKFEAASVQVRKAATCAEGAIGKEKAYSVAYQRLVSLGQKPKLKSKYNYHD